MSFSKYDNEDEEWSRDSRPRSDSPPPHHHRYSPGPYRHSPPPQSYREQYSPSRQSHYQHHSQSNYQKPGHQPFYQKWGSNNSSYKKQPTTFNNYKKPFHQNPNYRKPYSYNRQDINPRPRTAHTQPTDYPPSSFHRPVTKSNSGSSVDSSGNAHIMDAIQTYDTDRHTIAEVSQLLINEDKDMEDRILVAMEKVLTELKRKHDAHMKYINKTTSHNATEK